MFQDGEKRGVVAYGEAVIQFPDLSVGEVRSNERCGVWDAEGLMMLRRLLVSEEGKGGTGGTEDIL